MRPNEERLRKAQRKARRKFGFIIHLAVFLLVNLLLLAINLWSGISRAWAVLPFLGWGIGVLIHGASLLGPFERVYQWLLQQELARDTASSAKGQEG
jgi:hypothetical protein